MSPRPWRSSAATSGSVDGVEGTVSQLRELDPLPEFPEPLPDPELELPEPRSEPLHRSSEPMSSLPGVMPVPPSIEANGTRARKDQLPVFTRIEKGVSTIWTSSVPP
jgi:hypothetical protein